MSVSSTSSIASGAGILSSPGIGSGLDINSIVSQLMAVEQLPINAMQTQVSTDQSNISAFGQISTALTSFQSAAAALSNSGTSFQSYTATPSNTSVLGATVATGAVAGTHTINVSSLASTQVQVAATGYTSTTSALGLTGTLSFASGTSTATVTVASTDTLADIQNNINAASGNNFASASLVNDGSATPYKLAITANNSGTIGAVTVTDNLSTPFGITVSQPATDAKLTVDGIGISSSSNTVSSAITGVTLNLGATGSTSLGISLDTNTVTTNVQTLVTSYNSLNQMINSMRATGGQLPGNTTLLSLQDSLKNIFNTQASTSGSSLNYLTQAGVSFQADGTLSLDTTKLSSELTSNFSSVASLFSDSTQGFATRLNNFATDFLAPNTGTLATTTSGINNDITGLNTTIAQQQAALVIVQANYQAQFTALDTLMSSYTNTASFLTQQFAALTKSSA